MTRPIRIGQIVPSSNVTIEIEIPAMLHAREAILRVAARLINRKGYAGMSLADIAGELDGAAVHTHRRRESDVAG